MNTASNMTWPQTLAKHVYCFHISWLVRFYSIYLITGNDNQAIHQENLTVLYNESRNMTKQNWQCLSVQCYSCFREKSWRTAWRQWVMNWRMWRQKGLYTRRKPIASTSSSTMYCVVEASASWMWMLFAWRTGQAVFYVATISYIIQYEWSRLNPHLH